MSFQNRVISLLCLVLIGYGNVCHAQVIDENPGRHVLKAQEYIRLGQYAKAEIYLFSAVKRVREKESLWLELGNLQMYLGKYEAAAGSYTQAIKIKPANLEKFGLLAVDAHIKSENYSAAEKLFVTIDQKINWTPFKKQEYQKLNKQIEAKPLREKNQGKGVVVENLGAAINDEFADYFPAIASDDSSLIFTRRTGGMDEDFYIAYKDTCNEVWYQAENMGYPPNTVRNEGMMYISYDRNYRLFTRCDNTSDNGRAEGGCDIYLSYRIPEGWSGAEPFTEIINTPSFDGMTCLSSDNKTLYFVSDRPGGYGGMDIWKSTFKNDRWQHPENLGPKINTSGNETSPFIAADDKTLYFSSDGLPGMGGTDIFVSRKSNIEWTFPENIGAPYNSPFDDMSFVLMPNSRKAYFSSNRPGGYGNMDLYSTFLIERYQPEIVNFVYGFLNDSLIDQPVRNGKVEVYDMEDQLIKECYSNKGDGSFFITLAPYKKYRIRYHSWDYPAMETMVYYDYEQQHPPIPLPLSLLYWTAYDSLNIRTFDQIKEDPYGVIEYYEDEVVAPAPPEELELRQKESDIKELKDDSGKNTIPDEEILIQPNDSVPRNYRGIIEE